MPIRSHELDDLAPSGVPARCKRCGVRRDAVGPGVWAWGCPAGPDDVTEPIDVRVDVRVDGALARVVRRG